MLLSQRLRVGRGCGWFRLLVWRMSVAWLILVGATAVLVGVERALGHRVVRDVIERFDHNDTQFERPGARLARERPELRPRHPVVLVPGIISAGLEAWQARPCAHVDFRGRLWASLTMVQKALLCVDALRRHTPGPWRTQQPPPRPTSPSRRAATWTAGSTTCA